MLDVNNWGVQMNQSQLQELYAAIDYQPRGGDAWGDTGESVITLPPDYSRLVRPSVL